MIEQPGFLGDPGCRHRGTDRRGGDGQGRRDHRPGDPGGRDRGGGEGGFGSLWYKSVVSPDPDTGFPEDFDYSALVALRFEAREKLSRIRPGNLGQASRIPGVTPSDIAVLSVALSRSRS